MLPVRSSMVSASPYTEIEAHLLIISDTRLRLHFTQTHFPPASTPSWAWLSVSETEPSDNKSRKQVVKILVAIR